MEQNKWLKRVIWAIFVYDKCKKPDNKTIPSAMMVLLFQYEFGMPMDY